jgi:7-carboxy-7-deazaguanine synthase
MADYLVKEIFGPTIQGEGNHAGRSCLFLRLAGCNLRCTWCDTDFDKPGATPMSAGEICDQLLARDQHGARRVVVTGGEPTLQWTPTLAQTLTDAGFTIHMESNGTRVPAGPVDWLTVSPKPQFATANADLASDLRPDECKVVVDDTITATVLAGYQRRYPDCRHWYLQPCAGAAYAASLTRTLELIDHYPSWQLSLQLHKIVGLP